MDTVLSRWLHSGSEASKAALEKIHELGDHANLPMEIRLMILGHWLKER